MEYSPYQHRLCVFQMYVSCYSERILHSTYESVAFQRILSHENKFTLGAFIPADSPHLSTKHKGLHFLQPLWAAAWVLVLGNNTHTQTWYLSKLLCDVNNDYILVLKSRTTIYAIYVNLNHISTLSVTAGAA